MDWHLHRLKVLEARSVPWVCGVLWALENDARFDAMIAKLLAYWQENVT